MFVFISLATHTARRNHPGPGQAPLRSKPWVFGARQRRTHNLQSHKEGEAESDAPPTRAPHAAATRLRGRDRRNRNRSRGTCPECSLALGRRTGLAASFMRTLRPRTGTGVPVVAATALPGFCECLPHRRLRLIRPAFQLLTHRAGTRPNRFTERADEVTRQCRVHASVLALFGVGLPVQGAPPNRRVYPWGFWR